MKLKRILASVLVAAQVLGLSVAMAEETSPDTAVETTEAAAAETEVLPDTDEVRVYVSTDGNDSNDGSFEKPLATIARAVSVAEQKKSSNQGKTVAITIRGGDYYISKSIELPTTLSGTEKAPFVIQNYNGEEVNIKGSTLLETRKFTQLRDNDMLARIPEEARKYIGVYELSSAIVDSKPFTTYNRFGSTAEDGNINLIVDGEQQTIARYPNTGWDTIAPATTTNNNTWFHGTDSDARSRKWTKADNAAVSGFFGQEWAFDTIKVSSIENGYFTIVSSPSYGIGAGNRFYVQNLIEELDSPGEFYIDIETQKLYYYPSGNFSQSTLELTTMKDPLLKGENLSNITIKGIGIKNSRGNGIEFTGGTNIAIDNCEVANVGRNGIVMSDNKKAKITNCSIYSTGGSPIVLSGGNRATLEMSDNLVDNCHIYDFAKATVVNAPGVKLEGVGTTITNCLFHGSNSQGILFSGNEHTMMYNEFYDLVHEACDAGAIYAGRNYTMRGNEIAYNYFHDINTTYEGGGSIFVSGVYYDDLFSSVNTHHNLFYNCMLGVMIGGGRDHIFDNNLFVECETAMFNDARGVGWGAYHAAEGGQAYNTIFAVPYDKEPWISKYPEIAKAVEDIDNLGLPVGNSIQGNLMTGCQVNMIAPEMETYGTVKNNVFEMKTSTEYFKDYANRNFEIAEGSKIAKEMPELTKIKMSDFGLKGDKATEEKKAAEDKTFRLITPWNGTKDISNLSQTFTWEKHPAASSYIVRVADDPTMSNVIIEEKVQFNSADIKFIPSGGKAYWWTVTAVNDSESIKGEYTQTGAPKLIISTKTEQTNKTELRKNYSTLNSLYDAVKEGTAPGTYKAGYKDMVKEVLDRADAAIVSQTVLQKEIEEINTKTQEVIDLIPEYLNYDVVNVGDMLSNQSGWTYYNTGNILDGYHTFNSDGSLSLTGEAGTQNHYAVMMYDEPLGEGVAIKFGYKINIGSNYCIVGLQNDATFLKGGYDIIIKSNQLEIQRYVGANDGIKSTALNYYVSDNKWVDLEIGALKTGIGTLVYVKADGYMIDRFLDTNTPAWSGDSKFVFTNSNGSGIAEIRPAAE